MTLERGQITPVVLPQEEVEAPEIGGTVLVEGMDMPRLQRFAAARRRALVPLDGESEDDAAERASGELLPLALAMCVLAADGQPVYTAAQWAAFGPRYPQRLLALWQAVMRLSGLADEKKA